MSEAVDEGLLGSLMEIATDPDRVELLYGVLREYCHAFRNGLNGIQLSLFLARRADAAGEVARWDELEAEYRRMEQLVDQVQEICRPMAIRPIRYGLGPCLEERGEVWAEWMAEAGRHLELEGPREPVIGCFDPTRLIRALDALARWRTEAGEPGTTVRVSWRSEGCSLQVDWLEPDSHRLDGGSPGSGRSISLALPLLARVVSAHGGSLVVNRLGGLRFVLRWPAEVGTSARPVAASVG